MLKHALLFIGFIHTTLAGPFAPFEYVVVFKNMATHAFARQKYYHDIYWLQEKLTQQMSTADVRNGAEKVLETPFTILATTSSEPSNDGYVFPLNTATIRVSPQQRTNVLQQLKTQPNVKGVYLNRIYTTFQTTNTPYQIPREPLKKGERNPLTNMGRIQSLQWFRGNQGQVPASAAYQDLTVAVLDTGGSVISELNTIQGISFVDDRIDWTDRQSHATHVAGTIGAVNNGYGIYGVLPGVKILPIKVLNDRGLGTMSDIMQGLEYVAKNAPRRNIVVVNISLGGPGSALDPICDSIKAVVQRGVIVVVAAGNENRDFTQVSPAACPDAITVTAISSTSDQPAEFSNWLHDSAPRAAKWRTVSAPGVNILSTVPYGYSELSGTSMATPHVVGVAARCFAARECRIGKGYNNTRIVLNKVWQKYQSDPTYRWNTGSAEPALYGKYYGPLVWAKGW